MVFRQFSPSRELSAYVKCYWVLETDCPPGPAERILPDGCCELIFHYGDKFNRLTEDGFSEQPASLLVGQIRSAILLQATGRTGMFAIRFHPWGLYPFTGIPANEFTGAHLAAETLFPDMGELQEILVFSGDHEAMALHAGKFLLRILSKRKQRYFYNADRFAGIIRRMTGSAPGLSVTAVATLANMSERQFNRKFNEVTGLSPKHFMRITRMQQFIDDHMRGNGQPLSQLIYEHGYHDPAHFSHDFRSIAGINPTEYFEGLDGLGSAMLL
jgi:AraC-like DNA-binding protein